MRDQKRSARTRRELLKTLGAGLGAAVLFRCGGAASANDDPTSADGGTIAKFTTIYPGWYSGRAVHIHVKVRLFDGSSNTTTEATTQVFFDDATTDAVYASASPYNARGSRDTRNVADNIYANQTVLLLALAGDTASGYTGTISLGVQVGQVNAG